MQTGASLEYSRTLPDFKRKVMKAIHNIFSLQKTLHIYSRLCVRVSYETGSLQSHQTALDMSSAAAHADEYANWRL